MAEQLKSRNCAIQRGPAHVPEGSHVCNPLAVLDQLSRFGDLRRGSLLDSGTRKRDGASPVLQVPVFRPESYHL